jgi:hypothetical protein
MIDLPTVKSEEPLFYQRCIKRPLFVMHEERFFYKIQLAISKNSEKMLETTD